MTRLNKKLSNTLAVPLLLAAAQAFCAQPAPVAIAVLDFDYSDTSGESRDLDAAHRAQLAQFAQRIRDALAAKTAYRVVVLDCPAHPCTAREFEPEQLFALAKRAGARLLLYGGVHKMSTLVQWAQVQLVDVESDRLVDDRHLSFRGDSDEAWRRAADYVVEKMDGLQAEK